MGVETVRDATTTTTTQQQRQQHALLSVLSSRCNITKQLRVIVISFSNSKNNRHLCSCCSLPNLQAILE